MVGSASSLPFLEAQMSFGLDDEAPFCFLALGVEGFGAIGSFLERFNGEYEKGMGHG